MPKFTRYENVEHFVGRAHDIAETEALTAKREARREPKTRMKIMREQYLNLMRKHGYVMYQHTDTGHWFLTKNAGARHRMKLDRKIAESWIKEGIVFHNAGGWALKENRPVFEEIELAEIREVMAELKGKKRRV